MFPVIPAMHEEVYQMSRSTLRVMSFNIRGCIAGDGVNIWPNRAGLNVRTIRRHDPDIIGFQEMQAGNWDHYQAALPDYVQVQGPPYNNEAAHYAYPSLFFRPERFELISQDEFWISPTPDRHSEGWDTRCIRSSLVAALRCRITGKSLHIVNTHLDHIGPQARLEGAKLICQRLRPVVQQGHTVLVTGDFNCQPRTEPHQVFIDHGYRDTYNEAGQQDGPEAYSFHAFTGKSIAKPTHGRIDWIMHQPGELKLTASAAQILRDAEPPFYPSDHFPVLTEFTVG